MKKLILLLLPLFCFGQEMPIAIDTGGVWSISSDVLLEGQLGVDSVLYGKIWFDSVEYQSGGLLTLYMHDGTGALVDRMVGVLDNDTLWTTPDPMKERCANSCVAILDCVGGCRKDKHCECFCGGSGGCDTRNVAFPLSINFGELIRERILTKYGHYIP